MHIGRLKGVPPTNSLRRRATEMRTPLRKLKKLALEENSPTAITAASALIEVATNRARVVVDAGAVRNQWLRRFVPARAHKRRCPGRCLSLGRSDSRPPCSAILEHPICRRTGNFRAVQLLRGHTKVESTIRCLESEADDTLAIARQINFWNMRSSGQTPLPPNRQRWANCCHGCHLDYLYFQSANCRLPVSLKG